MMQRREDESITAFTMRLLTCEIVCSELQDLAQMFDSDPECRWTGSEIGDFLRRRIDEHPTFANTKIGT